MIYHYDLHIHSVLSPCADCLMTPNNIFNMAMLKGLDIIAVTDHNSLKQLKTCDDLSKSYDILFIPGVEVTVQEGFDILIYFKDLDDALIFDQVIEKYLPKTRFDETYYGNQAIMDINDELICNYPYLLIQPLMLTVQTLYQLLEPYDRLLVIPHMERQPKDIFNYLKDIKINAIETKHPDKYLNVNILNNSDAHQITEILESTKKNEILLQNLTIDQFFEHFKCD